MHSKKKGIMCSNYVLLLSPSHNCIFKDLSQVHFNVLKYSIPKENAPLHPGYFIKLNRCRFSVLREIDPLQAMQLKNHIQSWGYAID